METKMREKEDEIKKKIKEWINYIEPSPPRRVASQGNHHRDDFKDTKEGHVRSGRSYMHHHIATTTSSHRCGGCPPL
jgi:hypothetical protein